MHIIFDIHGKQIMTHTYDDSVIIPTLRQQLSLSESPSSNGAYFSAPDIDLSQYDVLILASSGGKDSIACLLRLKEMGVDLSKIELWHHEVDGREGSRLMDWTFMTDYNKRFADAMGVPIYFSWLEGGFEGEMLKENSYSRPHKIETPDGLITLERDIARAKLGTRRKFPQLSPSLQTRWCSSALKIDVSRRALNNQSRFDGKRILFITGERREESANRAKYNQLEPHACDRRNGRKERHVDAWRPILHWSEEDVWSILERHRIVAPVPYRLGWSRSSCMACIYNDASIWAALAHYFPDRITPISNYEKEFGTTISRKRINIIDVSAQAKPMQIDDDEALKQATQEEYMLPIILPEGATWKLPKGAFRKEGCGAV
jgi:3'-phosphoadenosine 5'-phosphosulfate sulfotransferase (PAPS reductase)/FAD synthetase